MVNKIQYKSLGLLLIKMDKAITSQIYESLPIWVTIF